MNRPAVLLPLLAALALAPSGVARAGTPPPRIRCGTPSHLPALRDVPRPQRVFFGGERPKVTRERFGDHQVLESTNFAVKWTDPTITELDAQSALDDLEAAWALYFGPLAHTPPPGSETFKINAYLSDADDNPPIDYAGGYATLDDEGYTYLVVSVDLYAGLGNTARSVLTHEFYHDIQLGLNVFNAESAYWYWEATADWAAQELDPDLADTYAFIGAFALRPDLPVFYYGDPFDTDVSGVHQYGASLFPRHLTDHFDRPTLVPESWETGTSRGDPLDALDGLMPEGTIADAYAEFAPRMALFDFEHGAIMQTWVDAYVDFYPDEDRYVLHIPASGTDGWVSPPAGREPRAFGANVIELARPASGAAYVLMEVDAAGSAGTPGAVQAVAVTQTPEGLVYTPVPITEGAGWLRVPMLTTAYLVVSATADTRSFDETFGYRFEVTQTPPPGAEPDAGPVEVPDAAPPAGGDGETDGEGPPDEEGGCGCSTRPHGAGGTAALLLLAGLVGFRSRGGRRRVRR